MSSIRIKNPGRGVEFDDRTAVPGSSAITETITDNESASCMMRGLAGLKNFARSQGSALKLAAAVSALCLLSGEAYGVDIVTKFNDNIVVPLHTLVHDNYGKGISILAMGYLLMSEGADMRTKATRAGIGVAFGYGLGNILFG